MVREKLTLKEKFIYRIILGERIYKHWYKRFLIAGVDLDRIRRVIKRIKNFYRWCSEWAKEGELVENLANEALRNGNFFTARYLFHEAAACYYVRQHTYFLDIEDIFIEDIFILTIRVAFHFSFVRFGLNVLNDCFKMPLSFLFQAF
ncbi:MAG: hypothetical protein ACTSRG_00025 [Candidatus Helarchaeota archaeon]